jgi:hypothetical protein
MGRDLINDGDFEVNCGKLCRPGASFFFGVMEGLLQAARGPLRVPMRRAPNDLARKEGRPKIVGHRRRRQVLVKPLHLVVVGARLVDAPALCLESRRLHLPKLCTCRCGRRSRRGRRGEV